MTFLAQTLVLALSRACAPQVAPETLASVAVVESRLNPLAIGVNGSAAHVGAPRTEAEAVETAERLERSGRDFDVGLAQLNVRTLKRLGVPLRAAFNPCLNLATAGQVLAANYRQGGWSLRPQTALRRALSLYNTGSPSRGLRNGYVARVERAAVGLRASPVGRSAGGAAAAPPYALAAIALGSSRQAPPEDVFAAADARTATNPVLVFS